MAAPRLARDAGGGRAGTARDPQRFPQSDYVANASDAGTKTESDRRRYKARFFPSQRRFSR